MNGTIASPTPLWMRLVFGRNPKRTLFRLICLVALTILLFGFVLIPIRVIGPSMSPTYKDGKIGLVNHLAYRWAKAKRGDVIAFRLPEEGGVVLIKRIVGLPGDRVRVIQGRAMVNGRLLDEPYVGRCGKDAPSNNKEELLDEDEYYVMGDNRDVSIFRKIPEHYILGKVLF